MTITLDDLDLEEIASSVYPKATAGDLSFATDDGIKESSRLAGMALLDESQLKAIASGIFVQRALFHETKENIVKETLSVAFHHVKDDPHQLLPLCWPISPRDDTWYYFKGNVDLVNSTLDAFRELLREHKLDFAKIEAVYRANNPLHDLGLLTPVIEKYLEEKGEPEAGEANDGEVGNANHTPNDFIQKLGKLFLALVREKSKSPDITVAESIRLSIESWAREDTKLEDFQKVAVWVGAQVGHHEIVTDDFVIALWKVIAEMDPSASRAASPTETATNSPETVDEAGSSSEITNLAVPDEPVTVGTVATSVTHASKHPAEITIIKRRSDTRVRRVIDAETKQHQDQMRRNASNTGSQQSIDGSVWAILAIILFVIIVIVNN